MASANELRLDADEVKKLLESATRQRVKDCLMIELRKIETQISLLASTQTTTSQTKPVKTTKNVVYPIKTYGWDQSQKFMKIYVTLNGVQDVPKEQITCTFEDRSFHLRCDGVNNKNYECLVTTLLEEVIPAESYYKVKTDSVLIMLKKKTESTWAYVTETEKKIKDKSKDKSAVGGDMKDPNEGLMNMMQKMYEEGDDDMKRSIAKAWTESNDKKKMGGGDMMV